MTVNSADIVRCSTGRDKGRAFLVLGTEDGKVLLADGKHRMVENPKAKNLKHIQFLARPAHEAALQVRHGDRITNKALRKLMAAFAAGTIEDQGGTSVG